MKKYQICLLLLSPLLSIAQYTDVINSNRPGKSMSAFSVGETVFQAEAGFFGARERYDEARYEANGFGSDLSIRYGAFWEQFELILDLQYQHDWYQAPLVDDTRSGLRQTVLGAKYLLYDPFKNAVQDKPNIYSWKANHKKKFSFKDLIPAISVYAGFNLRIGNNPFVRDDAFISPKGMLITQNHFGSRWVWVNNVIIDKFTTDDAYLGLVSTLTRGFNARWSGFLEFQGVKGDYYSDYLFRGGAAYLVRENIQIDASISKNIKETPDIAAASIGLSWRFDANYEKIYLRSTKPVDDKDKKGKKDKKKKRKDEVELEETKP
ncbi:transporter [Flavobacterium solisilvae]|uniref:Transporter n=1 Tax=Flavobacterium solisilvae TaxID=1852019 RepID=A0ABX1QR16_9FLAO|nr:transporter [Flavobacterium solisilvae]NMH24616.1 transporter [Flavobacterium solisilvae]